jgi:hypothetical protein
MDARACHPSPGVDPQKKHLSPAERDERQRQMVRERIGQRVADDFVVVDEPGSNLNMTPRYARALRGTRAIGSVPRNTPPPRR